jgi:hypothetical protein
MEKNMRMCQIVSICIMYVMGKKNATRYPGNVTGYPGQDIW